MENSKGITLVSLIITIIVLLILASIATYSGLNVINSSKLTTFTTELKMMQTEVNALYEEDNQRQIGQEITGDIQAQANIVFTEAESGITSQEGYRYWNQNLIKELGIEGIEQDFFINLEKRSVVSYKGFKIDGKTYYTLNQLPNGLYNVEYTEPTSGKPTFDVNAECIEVDKWRITVSNIQYDGYIDKWQVNYQLEGDSSWQTSENLSFVVNKNGNYKIQVVNGKIVSDEQNQYLGYVKDGLALYYDGINNTRNGHNPNASVWEDLSENKNDVNIPITTNKYWKSDALKFENTNEMVTLPNNLTNIINSKEFTLQLIFSEYEYAECDYPTILWSQNDNFSLYTSKNDWNFFQLKNSTNHAPDINKNLAIDKILTINFNLNNNSLKLYSNHELITENSVSNYINADNINLNRIDQIGTFAVKSLKIYNRALTTEEIENNCQIDKVRFHIK